MQSFLYFLYLVHETETIVETSENVRKKGIK